MINSFLININDGPRNAAFISQKLKSVWQILSVENKLKREERRTNVGTAFIRKVSSSA